MMHRNYKPCNRMYMLNDRCSFFGRLMVSEVKGRQKRAAFLKTTTTKKKRLNGATIIRNLCNSNSNHLDI